MTRAAMMSGEPFMLTVKVFKTPLVWKVYRDSPVTALAAAVAISSLESSFINHDTIQESRPPDS